MQWNPSVVIIPWSIFERYCRTFLYLSNLLLCTFHPPTRLFGVYPFLVQLHCSVNGKTSFWKILNLTDVSFFRTTHPPQLRRHKPCVRSLCQIVLPTYVPVKWNWIESTRKVLEERKWTKTRIDSILHEHPPTHDRWISITIYKCINLVNWFPFVVSNFYLISTGEWMDIEHEQRHVRPSEQYTDHGSNSQSRIPIILHFGPSYGIYILEFPGWGWKGEVSTRKILSVTAMRSVEMNLMFSCFRPP